MRPYQGVLTAAFVCILLAGASAQLPNLAPVQPPNLEPNSPHFQPVPTVSFDVAFPGASAVHYAISVEASGVAAYQSDNLGPEGWKESMAGDPYIRKFTVSEATCTRIFQLAKRANYFQGNFSTIKGPVVNASITTLAYSEGWSDSFGHSTNGARNYSIFSYTRNPDVLQLMRIFEGISNSIELGRQLDYLRHYDRSALDGTLKHAEDTACNHRLAELQAISQSLSDVARDPSATSLARRRAQQLLLLAQPSTQAKAAPDLECHTHSGN